METTLDLVFLDVGCLWEDAFDLIDQLQRDLSTRFLSTAITNTL